PTEYVLAGAPPSTLMNTITGKPTILLNQFERRPHPGGIQAGTIGHAFSKDGKMLAQASGGDRVYIWNATTGQGLREFKLHSWVSCVAFSPDKNLLAAGSGYYAPGAEERGAMQVWQVGTGKSLFPAKRFHIDVWGLAFSPDGRLLAAAMGDYGDVGA